MEGQLYIDQAALDSPPRAPSRFSFFLTALVQAGRARVPGWDDAERKAMVGLGGSEGTEVAAIGEAFHILCQAILDDKLKVFRRPVSGGELVPHPSSYFASEAIATAVIREGKYIETIAGPTTLRRGQRRGSLPEIARLSIDLEHYLFVDSEQLSVAFPVGIVDRVGELTQEQTRQMASSLAVRECSNWLADLFKSDTPGLPTRKAAMEEAFLRWPNGAISKRQFLNCYQSLSKSRPWMRRRGPRPKTSLKHHI
jgi:hypothetical protein